MVDMESAVDTMKEMVSQHKKINEIVYNQYKPIVSDLHSGVISLDEIEHALARMLDFCDDYAFLGLFKDVKKPILVATSGKKATFFLP